MMEMVKLIYLKIKKYKLFFIFLIILVLSCVAIKHQPRYDKSKDLQPYHEKF